MSEAEARRLLTAGRDLCVRYRFRDDGTIVFATRSTRRGALLWGAALAACTPHGDSGGAACDEDAQEVWCQDEAMVRPPTPPDSQFDIEIEIDPLHRRIVVPCESRSVVGAMIAREAELDSVVGLTVPTRVVEDGRPIARPREPAQRTPRRRSRARRWIAERLDAHRARKHARRLAQAAPSRKPLTRAQQRAAQRHERKMARRWRRLLRKLFRREGR